MPVEILPLGDHTYVRYEQLCATEALHISRLQSRVLLPQLESFRTGRGRNSQVHEHGGGALAAILGARIHFVVEPVVVRLVFLAVFVVQNLHALAVLHGQETDEANAPLNPPKHLRGSDRELE